MKFMDFIMIIGACAAVIGTWYSITNSKRCIVKKIERKKSHIRRIDHQLLLRFALDRGYSHPITPLDEEKERLQQQIDNLRRYL